MPQNKHEDVPRHYNFSQPRNQLGQNNNPMPKKNGAHLSGQHTLSSKSVGRNEHNYHGPKASLRARERSEDNGNI